MQVVVAVAVTWVGLMSLLVARARRHRRPGEPSRSRDVAPLDDAQT